MPLILGVDPGLTGALAFLDEETGRVESIHDMPTVGKPAVVCVQSLGLLLREKSPVAAAIEIAGLRPGQGQASSSRFVGTYWAVLGALGALSISFRAVSATKWKKDQGLNSDKDLSLYRACNEFPEAAKYFRKGNKGLVRKASDGRAEAALLAQWMIKIRRK